MRRFLAPLPLAVLALLTACEDDQFRIDPLLTTDTVTIAAPQAGSTLPSALDVTAAGGVIQGGRFPEQVRDAEQFDLVLRRRDGQLAFVPAGVLGLRDLRGDTSRAGITQPLNGQTFAGLEEAPERNAFVTDRPVPVQQGAVYAVRSRVVSCGFSGGEQYAKLQPLDVEPATGTVTLQITTNERCQDTRLVEPED